MSKYENYNSASSVYDKVRTAVGIDAVTGMIAAHSNKDIKDMHILDAGCGTGNPAKSLTQNGFRRLTLMDASSGMLNKAREKLADEISKGVVENVVEATLPEIPFSDKSFDAAMFSMVLHHLDEDADGVSFPAITQTLQETHRVLDKGGVLTILTPTPFSLIESIWWMSLLPEVTKRFVKRLPNIEQWERMFAASNFRCVNKLNIFNGSKSDSEQNDIECPLSKDWRKALSYWATATEEEIETMEEWMKKKISEGTLEQWKKQHSKNEIGTLILLVGVAQ